MLGSEHEKIPPIHENEKDSFPVRGRGGLPTASTNFNMILDSLQGEGGCCRLGCRKAKALRAAGLPVANEYSAHGCLLSSPHQILLFGCFLLFVVLYFV